MNAKVKNILISFLSLSLGISSGFMTDLKANAQSWDVKSATFLLLTIVLWGAIITIEIFIVTEAENALAREKRRSVATEERETLEKEIETEKFKLILTQHKREHEKI